MQFEKVAIAGVEVLAVFEGSGDCVKIDLAIATKEDGIQQLNCLIPHGLEDINWTQVISAQYKQASIRTLEEWISEGKLTPSEWQPKRLEYQPDRRGYADFWQIDQCVPIGIVNLLDEYCQLCSVENILSQRVPEYISDADKVGFIDRTQHWKQVNQPYLELKVQASPQS